jgi:hypothetical protein
LNSPLSKAIQLTTAACSALLVMLYVENDLDIGPAPWSAVAHSSGKGAELQSDDEGAISRSCDALIPEVVEVKGSANVVELSSKVASRAKRERPLKVIMLILSSESYEAENQAE